MPEIKQSYQKLHGEKYPQVLLFFLDICHDWACAHDHMSMTGILHMCVAAWAASVLPQYSQ